MEVQTSEEKKAERTDVLFCGVEIRKTKGHENLLLHVQDNNLVVHTIYAPPGTDDDNVDDVGTEYYVSASDRPKLKRFSSWKTREGGLGPVRGHTVTYHKWFGMQCWLHVELNLDGVGCRNVAVLVAEGNMKFLKEEQIRLTWSGAAKDLRREWPLGLLVEIEYDARMRKHRLKEEELAEVFPAAAFSDLGASVRPELREGAPG